MSDVGQGRKANDRRRVRAVRVVTTVHTGAAAKAKGFRVSRSAEFQAGTGRNGRA